VTRCGGFGALLGAVLLAAVTLGGCGGEQKAAELFSTAEFEERQSNREHARELYDQIIRDYPDTEWAGKARTRLQALDQTK
jgi:TolA-binding protein